MKVTKNTGDIVIRLDNILITIAIFWNIFYDVMKGKRMKYSSFLTAIK